MTKRSTQDGEWNPLVNLGPEINSLFDELEPAISRDGLELYFESDRPSGYGGLDIYVATRATKDDPWGSPVNLGPIVNSAGFEGGASISADGRALFFSIIGGVDYDLWVSTRRTQDDGWGPPVHLGPIINTSGFQAHDWCPDISADGSTLYFCAKRAGGFGFYDLWQTRISPIVDFNSDGKVDIEDLATLIEFWGQENPSFDIAPAPLGDGIVDIQDLEVLMDHWNQELDDPTLIAHWALDEAEGGIAYDSVGISDGTLLGDPVWEPDNGMVNGALGFEGVDDCIAISDHVLNPADGLFSVLMWVKGGAPGQVLISQVNGANWIMADPLEGTLMTEMSPPAARTSIPPLVSESLITDGNWHRIGFVWDGMTRALYVDGILVAEDAQTGLAGSNGGLNIGCGKDMATGTFFSGLIDDVRIYNRAVKP